MKILGRILGFLLRGLRHSGLMSTPLPPIEEACNPLPLEALASAGSPALLLPFGKRFPDIRLSAAEERIWNELVDVLTGRRSSGD